MSLSANLQTFYYILKIYMIFFAIITRHFHLKIYSRVSKKTIYSRKASDLSWWWTYFVNLQTEPPRGSLFVGISNSGCRTSCLPWVTYYWKLQTFHKYAFLLTAQYIFNKRAALSKYIFISDKIFFISSWVIFLEY